MIFYESREYSHFHMALTVLGTYAFSFDPKELPEEEKWQIEPLRDTMGFCMTSFK